MPKLLRAIDAPHLVVCPKHSLVWQYLQKGSTVKYSYLKSILVFGLIALLLGCASAQAETPEIAAVLDDDAAF